MTAITWRRLMLHIEPQVASQRFAFAAENIGPVPWRWVLVIDGDTDVARGQASFKATAIIKGTIARFIEWRAFAMEERTRQRVERRATNGSSTEARS